MSGLWLVSYVALWILFLVVAVVLLSVLRNLGTIYEVMQQPLTEARDPIKLIVGEPVPELRLQHMSGEPATLAAFRGQPSALIIISPGCGPCQDLLVALGNRTADQLGAQQQIVISLGSNPETVALVQEAELPPNVPVLIDLDHSVSERWGIRSTPTTVIVDEQLVFRQHSLGFNTQAPAAASLAVGM